MDWTVVLVTSSPSSRRASLMYEAERRDSSDELFDGPRRWFLRGVGTGATSSDRRTCSSSAGQHFHQLSRPRDCGQGSSPF